MNSHTSERLMQNVNRGLLGLALAALLFLFLVYLIYAVALFSFPFDYDQGEGFELWDAELFSRGEWIYLDNESYPFYSSNYAPLFPLLLAPLVKVFGPKLWVGRVFSFLTTLVTGGTIFWIVRRETRDRAVALLSGLTFFAANIVYQVGPLCRLHMTMVMFGLLGVAFMARLEDEEHGRRNLWLGMGFLLAAGYTKQLAFDAVAVGFAFFFLRRPKQALIYGAGFAAVTGLIFLFINVATDGQWWVNAITANANPFIPGQTEALFKQWFRLYPVIILLAAGYAAWTLWMDRLNVYSLYFVAATAKGVLSGKWGAGPGYFISSITAACVCTGIGLGLLRRWMAQRAVQESPLAVRWRWAGLALGAIVPLLFLYQARLNLHMPLNHALTRPVAQLFDLSSSTSYPYYVQAGDTLESISLAHDVALEEFLAVNGLEAGSVITPTEKLFIPWPYYDSMGYTQLGHLPTAADTRAGWKIRDWVRASSADGPPWSEEAMCTILAGQDDVVTNPTQLYNLANLDKLDVSAMVDMIYQRHFGLVIFRAQFYPPPVLDAIGQNYDVVEHIEMNGFFYAILRPRPREGG